MVFCEDIREQREQREEEAASISVAGEIIKTFIEKQTLEMDNRNYQDDPGKKMKYIDEIKSDVADCLASLERTKGKILR